MGLAFESAVVVQEGRLVERLGSVKAIPVGGAQLICVSVLLSTPARAIPFLPVGSIPTRNAIHGLLCEVSVLSEARLSLQLSESEHSFVLEPSRVASSGISRMGLILWRMEASTRGGSEVVLRMVCRMRLVSSL